MKASSVAVSDHEFVQKLLDRVKRVERSRRLMPDEARLVNAVRDRWHADGDAIALAPTHRETLLKLMRRIETRMKTAPYAPFY
jgi:hypothetical protein